MITAEAITEEINRLMVLAFPDAQAHINACPIEFDRPAYRIRCESFVLSDANRSTVSVSAAFEIAYLPVIDKHGIADGDALTAAQSAMMSLFSPGYLRVADRCLKIKRVPGQPSADASFVSIQLDYFDDRPMPADNPPLMGSVKTTIKGGS